MDSDRIGKLINLMKVIDHFDAMQYHELLSKLSQTLSTEFMKTFIFYGFYALLTINKNKVSNTTIDALNNVIKLAMNTKDTTASLQLNKLNVATNESSSIQHTLKAFDVESLQQLVLHRNIKVNNMENKHQLKDKITDHLLDHHAVKSFKYHHLSLQQLQVECALFNSKYDSKSISNTLQCLLDKIYKVYPIHLTQLPTSILCFICTYLDMSSLLHFELTNRSICIDARKPQCMHYGLRCRQYTKYIRYHYNTKYNKYNVLPDLYRFSQSNNLFVSSPDTVNKKRQKYDDIMNDEFQNICQNRIRHLYISSIGYKQNIVHLPNLMHIRLAFIASIKYTNILMDQLFAQYNNDKCLHLNVFSIQHMDFILYEDEMNDNMYSVYRFIAFILPQFWIYHPMDVFEETAQLLDNTHKSKCMKFNILELIRIDDGDCSTEPYNTLLELFNDRHTVQCCLKKQIKGFVSFGSANNSLCNALSNTIMNVLSQQLCSLHLWSEEDDFSFVVWDENSVDFYNLNELCMELISDNSFDLFKTICKSAKLRVVHFEINMESMWFDECALFIQCITTQLFMHQSLNWIEIEMNDAAKDIMDVYDVFNKIFKVKDCTEDKLKHIMLKINAVVHDDEFNSSLSLHTEQIMCLFNNMRRCYEHCMLLLKFEFNMYRHLVLRVPEHQQFMQWIQTLVENDDDIVYNCNYCEDGNNREMSISIALSTKDCKINGYHTDWFCQCDKCYSNTWFDGQNIETCV